MRVSGVGVNELVGVKTIVEVGEGLAVGVNVLLGMAVIVAVADAVEVGSWGIWVSAPFESVELQALRRRNIPKAIMLNAR